MYLFIRFSGVVTILNGEKSIGDWGLYYPTYRGPMSLHLWQVVGPGPPRNRVGVLPCGLDNSSGYITVDSGVVGRRDKCFDCFKAMARLAPKAWSFERSYSQRAWWCSVKKVKKDRDDAPWWWQPTIWLQCSMIGTMIPQLARSMAWRIGATEMDETDSTITLSLLGSVQILHAHVRGSS